MRTLTITVLTLMLLPTSWPSAQAPSEKTLDVYFIDVEGRHATLYVSPSGQSMLKNTTFERRARRARRARGEIPKLFFSAASAASALNVIGSQTLQAADAGLNEAPRHATPALSSTLEDRCPRRSRPATGAVRSRCQ